MQPKKAKTEGTTSVNAISICHKEDMESCKLMKIRSHETLPDEVELIQDRSMPG